MTTPSSHQLAKSIIAKVQASSKAHARFAKDMYPVQVEYVWPKQEHKSKPSAAPQVRPGRDSGLCIGQDPQDVIQDNMAAIQNPQLREFLQAVVQEPEVKFLMCMRRNANSRKQQYGVECLHLAAREASCHHAISPRQREAVYTATILMGCKTLLVPNKSSKSTADDILFTIVRQALHRLDDSAPKQARLLRLCLGWGSEEETQTDIHYGLKRLINDSLERALKNDGSARI
jgi:hypothetical protein